MTIIKIKTNSTLAAGTGEINRTTWELVEKKTIETAFFPKGKLTAVDVESPSGKKFVLRIVNSGVNDNEVEVSSDVKTDFYPDTDSVEV